jgi:hypothetical protein
MRAGKKKRGSGGNEFLPVRPVWGGKAFPQFLRQQEGKNRKIFVSLIEKNFGGAQLKNVKKIFLFCSPSGERKRWAGFLPVRAEIVARKRFELRPVIATIRNLTDFAGSLFARSPRLRRGFARIFPYISAQIKSIFCPAGGGSALQSNAIPQGGISNFFLSAFGGIRSQFLFSALYGERRLIKN